MNYFPLTDRNFGIRLTGSHNGPAYALLAGLALFGIILLILGLLPVIPFLGMEFALVFSGILLTNLRSFILIYFGLRTLMEIFMEPTRIAVGNASIHLVGVVGAIVMTGGIIYILVNNLRIREASIVIPMIAFLGITFPVLWLISPEKMVGFKDWVGTASAFTMFVLVAVTFKTRRDLVLLLRVIVFSSIIPLLFGFYQALTGSGWAGSIGLNRIRGTFVHPNAYAFYLAVMILLCIPLFLESKKRLEQAVYGGLIGLMTISLVLTYARGAWIGLISGIFVLALVRYRKLLLLAPVAVGLIFIFIPSIADRFHELTGFSQGKGSMYFRVMMWRYLFPYFFDNPIVGVGLGGFTSYVEKGMGFVFMAHNDYLRVLVDTGIVGLTAYLAIWLSLAKSAARCYKKLKDPLFQVIGLAVLAIAVAYLVNSATDNLFRFSLVQSYIWCLGGMLAAAVRLEFPDGIYRHKPAEQLVLPGLEASNAAKQNAQNI